MAHWAELDDNNIVIRVVVTDNNDPNGDEGLQWLQENVGGNWVKTSYNSWCGYRLDANREPKGTHFRYNFAGVGYSYDPVRDAFIPPKPHTDAVLDETMCVWIDVPVSPDAIVSE